MSRDFDFLVFIGRFQPFHRGHLGVVEKALALAENVIVLIGSARQPPSFRNPWNHGFREHMLRSCLSPDDNRRVLTAALTDSPYNEEAWVRTVQATVQHLVDTAAHTPSSPRIGLIGINRQNTAYYPKRFPQWQAIDVATVDDPETHPADTRTLDATTVREGFFAPNGGRAWLSTPAAQTLPDAVQHALADYAATPAFTELAAEHAFICQYRDAWHAAPYPPMFITVDALVVQSGHLLLIERKGRPGKGLWALPGGFLDSHESIVDACLRELHEETRLDVPVATLRGAIRCQEVFDAPYRSARGRTVTHAFLIELEPATTLPRIEGGDDAARAVWLPLARLDPQHLFEDHYFIIQKMLGL